ncbi:MAG TPA: hypothetical protein PK924_04625 [Bacilli bacterium]|nr:hypothetical protein [Bacilli bacterium]
MTQLEKDLVRCLSMINPDWKMQNNFLDRQTNFIYQCDTLDECLNQINERNVDREYALHRWYNYMTSIACENIFCDYGAVHEDDLYNHDIDIYIDGVPFDVKLTVYPAKLSNRPYNLKTRQGKNQMIQWYYANQSQQARKQLLNRIYVVCDASSQAECLEMKSDFSLLREKIQAFMNESLQQGVNTIQIVDNGNIYNLQSDIVYISYDQEV